MHALAWACLLLIATTSDAGIRTYERAYTIDRERHVGFFAIPEDADGPVPGVLVCHAWWGHDGFARQKAEELAELGYAAFVLDMYGEGRYVETVPEAQQLVSGVYADRELMRRRARAGLEVLATHEEVDARYLGAIGYCFGGTVALELARSGADLDAVVSFHGNPSTPVPDASQVKATLLVLNGAADELVPQRDIDSFHSEMERSGVDYVFINYGGALHSFTEPEADARGMRSVGYDKNADERSWEAMRALFRERLTAPPGGTLAAKLAARKQDFITRAPVDTARVYDEGVETVRKTGIELDAKNVGDTAPGFSLPNATGQTVRLAELLEDGPVVLTWYRGGWCPYCNIALRDLQERLPEFERLGATLVAVSPELPDKSLDTQEKNELEFVVLSDEGNRVAGAYGIAFKLPEPVVDKFRGRLDIPAYNGDESWSLPLAATYVIDRSGTIRWAFVDADYRNRAEPADVLEALRDLEN